MGFEPTNLKPNLLCIYALRNNLENEIITPNFSNFLNFFLSRIFFFVIVTRYSLPKSYYSSKPFPSSTKVAQSTYNLEKSTQLSSALEVKTLVFFSFLILFVDRTWDDFLCAGKIFHYNFPRFFFFLPWQ